MSKKGNVVLKLKRELDLESISEEFLLYKETEVSIHTIKNFKSAYRNFFAFCATDLNNEAKLKLNTMRFLANKSNEYYNKQLQALKQLYDYAIGEGNLVSNPCSNLKYKSHTKKIVSHSNETIKLLLDLPDKESYAGLRDYVIMLVQIDTGIRPAELVQLTLNDVDMMNKFINIPEVVSKTRQFRTVPMSDFCINALKKIIGARHVIWSTNLLFPNYIGKPLSTKELRYRFQQYSNKLGISVTPYDLRHTFALMFLRNGGNVFALQKIMGHTKLDQTRNYVNLIEADMQNSHKSASPISNLLAPKPENKRLKRL